MTAAHRRQRPRTSTAHARPPSKVDWSIRKEPGLASFPDIARPQLRFSVAPRSMCPLSKKGPGTPNAWPLSPCTRAACALERVCFVFCLAARGRMRPSCVKKMWHIGHRARCNRATKRTTKKMPEAHTSHPQQRDQHNQRTQRQHDLSPRYNERIPRGDPSTTHYCRRRGYRLAAELCGWSLVVGRWII